MSSPAVPVDAAGSALLWRRFACMLYDLLPLLGLWVLAAGLWMLAFHRSDDLQQMAASAHAPLATVLQDLWLLIVTAAYFVVSWMRVGQTIGMRAWKLKLVRADGSLLDRRTALLRFVLALLSLAALGCGFWCALLDQERRTWHDRVCGTRMLRLPRKR